MEVELAMQEEFLVKRKQDMERQRLKLANQKQKVKTQTLEVVKTLSEYDKKKLLKEQSKIKDMQVELAKKYNDLEDQVEQLDKIKTKEKLELEAEERKNSGDKKKAPKEELKTPIEEINGKELKSVDEIYGVIDQLKDKKNKNDAVDIKVQDDGYKIKDKIWELKKLKLQKEEEELIKLRDSIIQRHQDLINKKKSLLDLDSDMKNKATQLAKKQDKLEDHLRLFDRQKLENRAEDLKMKEIELKKNSQLLEQELKKFDTENPKSPKPMPNELLTWINGKKYINQKAQSNGDKEPIYENGEGGAGASYDSAPIGIRPDQGVEEAQGKGGSGAGKQPPIGKQVEVNGQAPGGDNGESAEAMSGGKRIIRPGEQNTLTDQDIKGYRNIHEPHPGPDNGPYADEGSQLIIPGNDLNYFRSVEKAHGKGYLNPSIIALNQVSNRPDPFLVEMLKVMGLGINDIKDLSPRL